LVFLVQTWRGKIDLSQSPTGSVVLDRILFSWVMFCLLFLVLTWLFLGLLVINGRGLSSGLQVFGDLYVIALRKATGELPIGSHANLKDPVL